MKSALAHALRDSYRNSWRLLVLNSCLAGAALAILAAASYVQTALLLLVLLGPLAAALMHCAVVLVTTEELQLRDALVGLRLHWRRGLALGAIAAGLVGFGVFAVTFYARGGLLAWPLGILVVYLLALFAVWQLVVWPLAVAEPRATLRSVWRDAGLVVLRRPRATVALAFALLVVNLAGAAAILPLLTLTVAYSFIAAAHFALPTRQHLEARH